MHLTEGVCPCFYFHEALGGYVMFSNFMDYFVNCGDAGFSQKILLKAPVGVDVQRVGAAGPCSTGLFVCLALWWTGTVRLLYSQTVEEGGG